MGSGLSKHMHLTLGYRYRANHLVQFLEGQRELKHRRDWQRQLIVERETYCSETVDMEEIPWFTHLTGLLQQAQDHIYAVRSGGDLPNDAMSSTQALTYLSAFGIPQ